jgi:tetratricopeptide (TPR) repeat protein
MGPARGPFDTPERRLAALIVMGLLTTVGVVTITVRLVTAKPVIVPSDAEESYRQGLRLFGAGEYERAKIYFSEALRGVPDSREAKRYLLACDIELRARAAIQAAQEAAGHQHFLEAVKALGGVDSTSLRYDEAMRLRKQYALHAADEAIAQAKRVAQEDPTSACALIKQARELDPGNAEAKQLEPQMCNAAPVAVPVPKKKEPPPPRQPPEPRHVKKDTEEESGPPEVRSAVELYKHKLFGESEKAYRLASTREMGKASERLIEIANQVRTLRQTYEKALAEETSNPTQATKDFEDAIALDAKLGKGVHAAFFKTHLGKVELGNAQAAFSQGKYEDSYKSVVKAQRLGAGDGGLLKQLETKAAELVDKGEKLQKSNLGQAKAQWRQVTHMVPSGSPSYTRAYSKLNNAGAGRKDEDED